ncbi:hypothetical protein Q5752_002853 [Cryptotrichosporon argae]
MSAQAPSPAVPRVGGIRCYWALLQPDFPDPAQPPSELELRFVHFDPVLAVHLARQQLSMRGRGLFEFIHPAEREQARRDMSSTLAIDDLQGSITRLRFARLSRIRTLLGAATGEVQLPYDTETFVEDDEYLIIDLVLNWVADGLLLAFFHAIKDKDPVANNDPMRAHEEWTNFCGTAEMPGDQVTALHQTVMDHIAIPTPGRYPPSRVFQLHSTASTSPLLSPSPPMPVLLFSWPPPRVTPTYGDGSYNAADYADLMRGVDMDSSRLAVKPGELRTNCTTRFGAEHSVRTEGCWRHISSVFIPYGTLIFACFQTTKLVEIDQPPPLPLQLHAIPAPPPPPPPPPPAPHMVPSQSQPHQQPLQQRSPIDYSPMPPHALPQAVPSPIPPHLQHASHLLLSLAAPHMPHPSAQPPPHPALSPLPPHPHSPWTKDPPYPYAPPLAPHPPPVVHADYPPPPAVAFIPAEPYPQPYYDAANPYGAHEHSPNQAHHGGGAPGSASTRPLVPPPGDVEKCSGCGTRVSPEWRKGENGIKDLCNACGLKLARMVAKREGRQKPRKKKDKAG